MKRIINIIKAKLGFNYDPYLIASAEQKALWTLQSILINDMKKSKPREIHDYELGIFDEALRIYEQMEQYF